MTDKKEEPTPKPEAGTNLSRRSLLAGSAGLTFAGALGSQAVAQEGGHAAHQQSTHMSHGTGSLSGRLYQVNPGMPEHNDIAHDPADIPAPITRRAACARKRISKCGRRTSRPRNTITRQPRSS